MDAIPFFKLARLIPVALVCFLTVAPALRAEESHTNELVQSKANRKQDEKSASGTLVVVTAAKPESATRKRGNRTWKHPAARSRDAGSAAAASQAVQLASNEEEIVAVAKQRKKALTQRPHQRTTKAESADSTAQMLIRAHELSKQASTEADYEEIAVTCDTAERLGLSGDQLEFALQLHSWAIKHRDKLRVQRIQHQLRAEKTAQQRHAKQSAQKLQVQRAKQQLLAAQAEEELCARKIEQQLRAEKAEEELKSLKIQQQLQAEVAAQQLRAQKAEQNLRAEQADLALPSESIEEDAQDLIEDGPDAGSPGVDQKASSAGKVQQWEQLHDRGVTYAEQGKYAEALDDFNRVIQLNPMFPKAYANRATLFTQSGDLEQAQVDYERACTLDPKLLHAQLGLGRVYHLLGSKEEAFDCFCRAIELDPDNAEIVCSRADLLADMGRYRDALADYAQAIDLNPEFAHAYRNGAWLLATCPDSRFRDPTNAVRGAQRALDFDYGERHVTLDTLAAAQASAGDFDQAVENLQEALKIAPHEARSDYRSRLQAYQAHQPFYTEPVEDVSQVVYEISDR